MIKALKSYFQIDGASQVDWKKFMKPRRFANAVKYVLNRNSGLVHVPYYPLTIMLEVSTFCNFSCPACERELYKSDTESTGGFFKENVKLEEVRHLESLLPYLYSVYLVSGLGEPFINREFWDIVDYLRSFDVKIGYFTNASLLDEEKIAKTFEKKINTVLISMDTYDPEKYERVKSGGNFENTVNMIKLFAEYKKRNASHPFHLGLNYIFRADNYQDILPYLDFAKELGVEYVHCSSVIVHIEKMKEISFFNVPYEEKKRLFDLAAKKAERLGIGLRLPNIKVDKKTKCSYPWHGISVFKGGQVAMCPYFRTKREFYYHLNGNNELYEENKRVADTILGSCLKENILDIWNNERIKQIRKGELKIQPHVSPCDTCYFKHLLH
ncbi:MAG TPA: radical SAM protein [Nitrospirae bacterium]|nr:molybdenum cofactor biosynthesis protein A [bacterium BMS3Abin06]HDH12910.1 radical SAM protein [Nitrospirota bacterium]HDZ01678.1 radical SAM protein [Nitrospirota bacterium]